MKIWALHKLNGWVAQKRNIVGDWRLSKKLLSVDDVIKSGPFKLIGQFRCNIIGCKSHV